MNDSLHFQLRKRASKRCKSSGNSILLKFKSKPFQNKVQKYLQRPRQHYRHEWKQMLVSIRWPREDWSVYRTRRNGSIQSTCQISWALAAEWHINSSSSTLVPKNLFMFLVVEDVVVSWTVHNWYKSLFGRRFGNILFIRARNPVTSHDDQDSQFLVVFINPYLGIKV